jgi:homoserine kinase type II
MQEQGTLLAVELPEEQLPLLRDSLAEIARLQPRIRALPQANLHADLFRDNVLFEGTHLTGVIDFYNACSGPMLYDVAIAVNDWCSHPNGEIDQERSDALLAAYSTLRHFTPAEAQLWHTMLRLACVRFWLSRLIAARHFAGLDVTIKNPEEFRQLLAARQQPHSALPFAF